MRPTQRAADVGESAALAMQASLGIFLTSSFPCSQALSTLRPSAGNAIRWAGQDREENLILDGKRVWVLAALLALSLAAGCGRSGEIDTALPTQTIQPAVSPEPPSTPDIGNVDSAPICPTANGVGTVSPTVSIFSITFLVNGIEQIVLQNNMLQAEPGDELQIREVIICASPFSGNGGQACVDFAPTDDRGQEITFEHKGTDTVLVTPGQISISGLNFTWSVGENWSGFYAVLNHWPPVETQDLGCANGLCERDDWIIVKFH